MLRVVRAEGDADRRGRAIGAELGDLIDRSLLFYRTYLDARGADRFLLERLVGPYRAAAALLSEESALLDAVAAGAGVDLVYLWAVNALEELDPLLAPVAAVPERCTTFSAVTAGATILAHNEQWLAGDAGNLAVVVEVPQRGPALVSPTVACCLPAVGINGHALAQGIDSLTAADDRVGIPRVLVSRHALVAADVDDAARRATIPGRAGGYAHVLAQRGCRAATVETSAVDAAILRGPGAHANHYLDPRLAGGADPGSGGSAARYARLAGLLEERPPATAEDAMALMRDHSSSPQSICEHGDRDDASVVLFSMVCELEQGRMWVAAGNPCEARYEEVDLSDVLP